MNNKKLNCHPELVAGFQQNCTASRDIAENAKLNHEIAEELRKYTPASLENKGRKFSSKLALKNKQMGLNKTVCLLTAFTLFPTFAHAESCVATPKCEDLGYTASSCPDNKGVRCPWNTSLWHCDSCPKCSDLGFNNTCTGTGYAGGGSAACDGKYNVCSCAENYVWRNGACEDLCADCHIGCILNSDKTCSTRKESDLTPIGVVFYHRKAVALSDIGTMNWSSANSSCSSYSIGGVSGWYLPSKDELLAMYNNRSSFVAGFSKAGGKDFVSGWYWSSFPDYYYYWIINPVSGSSNTSGTSYSGYVRPVLAF